MKFKTSSTFKSLINAVGKIEHLKPHSRINTVDALRLPSYYDKHKNLSLYSGEWRHVNCDCIHFDDEVALRRELALARIAKYNPLVKQEINRKPAQESKDSSTHSVLEIEGYYPHINMVSYGNLQEVEQELLKLDKRSLLIPLDALSRNSYTHIEHLAEEVKSLRKLEKIVLCVSEDNTWNVVNKLLKL